FAPQGDDMRPRAHGTDIEKTARLAGREKCGDGPLDTIDEDMGSDVRAMSRRRDVLNPQRRSRSDRSRKRVVAKLSARRAIDRARTECRRDLAEGGNRDRAGSEQRQQYAQQMPE